MKTVAKPVAQANTVRSNKTTGINLPTEVWELLNRVAFERARRQGGRASVSALLVGLVEKHRRELERELAKAM
jgi:hypothetical protein